MAQPDVSFKVKLSPYEAQLLTTYSRNLFVSPERVIKDLIEDWLQEMTGKNVAKVQRNSNY